MPISTSLDERSMREAYHGLRNSEHTRILSTDCVNCGHALRSHNTNPVDNNAAPNYCTECSGHNVVCGFGIWRLIRRQMERDGIWVPSTVPETPEVEWTPPPPPSAIRTEYKGFNPGRRFGVEIECVGLTGPARDDLYRLGRQFGENPHTGLRELEIVSDGSIRAHPMYPDGAGEIRLGPWRADEGGFRKLREVCRVLTSYRVSVNRSCGLHVHHDIAHLASRDAGGNSEYSPRGIVAERARFLYHAFSPAIELFLRSHRWANEYCMSMLPMSTSGLRSPHTRYYSVNGPTHHGTIEYRQHQGTVKLERIANWVAFTNMLTEYAEYGGTINLYSGLASYPLNDMWSTLMVPGDVIGKSVKRFYGREMRRLAKSRRSPIPRMTFDATQLDGCKRPAVETVETTIRRNPPVLLRVSMPREGDYDATGEWYRGYGMSASEFLDEVAASNGYSGGTWSTSSRIVGQYEYRGRSN